MKRRFRVKPRLHLVSEIALMRLVRKNLAGDEERDIGRLGGLDREVNPFFRADAAEHHRVIALGVAGLQGAGRDAVLDRRQEAGAGRARFVLGAADAVQRQVFARPQCLGRIPGRWQVQGRQDRDALRPIGREIDPVQMHKVDRPGRERPGDRSAVARPGAFARGVVESAGLGRHRHQRSGDLGPVLRDHEGAVACLDERLIDMPQNLLGAADRIGADARQRIGHAEDGQGHRASDRPSSRRAPPDNSRQRAPVMPQP
jgi:hypothetical protein